MHFNRYLFVDDSTQEQPKRLYWNGVKKAQKITR